MEKNIDKSIGNSTYIKALLQISLYMSKRVKFTLTASYLYISDKCLLIDSVFCE